MKQGRERKLPSRGVTPHRMRDKYFTPPNQPIQLAAVDKHQRVLLRHEF